MSIAVSVVIGLTGALATERALAQPAGVADQNRQALVDTLGAAQTALAQANYSEAIRNARAALALDPKSAEAINILIRALSLSGDDAQALSEAERLIADTDSNAVLLSQRGFLRRKAGQLDRAAADLARARDLSSATDEQRRNIGAALTEIEQTRSQQTLSGAQDALARRDFAEAVRLARSAADGKPASESTSRILVDALDGLGRTSEALAAADRWIAAGSASGSFYAARGYLRRKSGDLAGAIADFRRATQDSAGSATDRQSFTAAAAEAEAAQDQQSLANAQKLIDADNVGEALAILRPFVARQPDSAFARRLITSALAKADKFKEAIEELGKTIELEPNRADLYAQRGYYRRRLQDLDGAKDDFVRAQGLSQDASEIANMKKAVAEIESVQRQGQVDRSVGREAAARTQVDRLMRAKRYGEALRVIAAFEAEAGARAWSMIQRGLIYRETGRYAEAASLFRAALRDKAMDRATAANVRFWEVDSRAQLLRAGKDIDGAIGLYNQYLLNNPKNAEAWYRLGYLLLAEKRINEASTALLNAVTLRPTTAGYLDTAGTFVLTDAPLASKLYRKGLDGVAQRKPEDTPRSAEDIEQIKNNVVRADNSFRMTLSASGIAGRAASAGGSAYDTGGEATVRFDGRYLPAIEGLEAYASGYYGTDSTRFAETNAQFGVRWRPFRDIDFSLGPSLLQRFEPDTRTQLALNWGLGLGGAAYPYQAKVETSSVEQYWDFSAFGTYRAGDGRYLQDFIGNAGVMFGARGDKVKSAIGPTAWGLVSFDSAAAGQWAAGAGPSVMGRVWLGGDQYRSYDALLQFQLGYIVAIGNERRQEGWRGKIILYY